MSRQCSAKAKRFCSVEVIHSGWHHGRTSCVCSARQGIKCSEWCARCAFWKKNKGDGAWSGTRNLIRYSCRSSPWSSKQLLLFFSFGFAWGHRVWLCHCGTHCVIVQNYCTACCCLISPGPETFTPVHLWLLRKSPASCMKACVCLVAQVVCLGSLVPLVASLVRGDTKWTSWDTNCQPVSWWIKVRTDGYLIQMA